MRPSLLLLVMLALPLSARAQTALDGAWTLTFMMHEDASQTLNVTAQTVQDTLNLTVESVHGNRALEAISFKDDVLTFVLPTGHGSVTCTLYRKKGKEDFTGICQGSMGEIPTTMKRSAGDSDTE